MAATLLVHYQELALKGLNRPWFVDRLVRNLRETTAGLGVAEVRPIMGRIELRLESEADIESVLRRVERTLGVANVALAKKVEPDLQAITAAALELVRDCHAESFRVTARRADKSFPLRSPDIERHVGGIINDVTGWQVNLSRPQFRVLIEIVPRAAYVSVHKRRGPAGLPVGVSGRVACLLSGGIDSPVAAFRLMRRGCRVVFVHFHSYPLTSNASIEKARRLVQILTTYQLRSRLVLVPFADLQRTLVISTPPAMRVVIYRRFMLRIAERIARRMRARALVTGEAVGQVASQTLENIAAIEAAVTWPVLRPLIGMDKEEICAQARAIGTLEVSELPDEDCCQVLTPRHPAINVSRAQVERVEAGIAVDELIEQTLQKIVREEFSFEGVLASERR